MSTVKAALTSTTQRLAALPHCDSAALDARLLIEHISGLSHTQLITRADSELSTQQLANLSALIKRREAGEPVAYLLEEWGFYDLELTVNKHVLVPRPETELLVEWFFSLIPARTNPAVCDLGTGTGAIAIAVGKHRPDATVTAVDNSAEALAVARHNIKKNRVTNVTTQLSSWLENVDGHFDCIVTNPPYIGADEPELALLQHEPRQALVASNNGLADIEEIISQATSKLTTNGWLLFEHGHQQADVIADLFEQHGYSHVQQRADLTQTIRYSAAQLI